MTVHPIFKVVVFIMFSLASFAWAQMPPSGAPQDITQAKNFLAGAPAQKVLAFGLPAAVLLAEPEASLPNLTDAVAKLGKVQLPSFASAERWVKQRALLQGVSLNAEKMADAVDGLRMNAQKLITQRERLVQEAQRVEALRGQANSLLAQWEEKRKITYKTPSGWGNSALDRISSRYDQIYAEFLHRHEALSLQIQEYKRARTFFKRTGRLLPAQSPSLVKAAAAKAGVKSLAKKMPLVLLAAWAVQAADDDEAKLIRRLQSNPALVKNLSAEDMEKIIASPSLAEVYMTIVRNVYDLSFLSDEQLEYVKENGQYGGNSAYDARRAEAAKRLLSKELAAERQQW